MTSSPAPELDTAAAVLAFAGERARDRRAADADVLYAACCWADQHPAPDAGSAASFVERFGDTGLSVAGRGAPWVSEFAVPALAAALGSSTEAGRVLLGEALELRHRLPRLWAAVQDGSVEAWRARRVARATISHDLTVEAAGFVDTHVAAVAQKVGVPTIDRLVDEAIARHMPALDADRQDPVRDPRGFGVDTSQVSFAGTMRCEGELEVPDAYALDAAVKDEMTRLRGLGSTEAPGPLAAQALVGLACRGTGQDTLDLEDGQRGRLVEEGALAPVSRPADQPTGRRRRQRDRTLVLHVHLAESALVRRDGRCPCGRGTDVARLEEARRPISTGLVRDWAGAPATTRIVVRPVRDLAEAVHVEAYEVPDRLAEQTDAVHLRCVFPYCGRRATGCDKDHAVAYDHERPDRGGPTCSCNIAPLCRGHHRLKTHGHAATRWTITPAGPAAWLWRSPHGHHYLRDHTGTRPLDGPLAHTSPPRGRGTSPPGEGGTSPPGEGGTSPPGESGTDPPTGT